MIEVRLLSKNQAPNCSPGAAAIWLPTAPGVCSLCVCVCVCVFTAVCVHLDRLNAEHKFRVWITILGHTSRHFTFTKLVFVWLRKSSFALDCFLNEGQFKAGFVKKLKLKDGAEPIVHVPAAPPEELSLTLDIFYDYLRIAFALPQ